MSLSVSVKFPDGFGEERFASALEAVRGAVARALSNCLIEHFRAKNTRGNAKGFPRSNYWAQAADSVTSRVDGDTVIASITHPGVRLRWLGGTVTPKRGRAMAIPVHPSVANVWPSEMVGKNTFAVWLKDRQGGFIASTDGDNMTVLWRLVRKATHLPDSSVMPSMEERQKVIRQSAIDVFEALGGRSL